MNDKIRVFEQKIEEYFLSCYPDLVSMEDKEAVVKYDTDVAKVEDLIKAVKQANGPHGPYDAKVKKK